MMPVVAKEQIQKPLGWESWRAAEALDRGYSHLVLSRTGDGRDRIFFAVSLCNCTPYPELELWKAKFTSDDNGANEGIHVVGLATLPKSGA